MRNFHAGENEACESDVGGRKKKKKLFLSDGAAAETSVGSLMMGSWVSLRVSAVATKHLATHRMREGEEDVAKVQALNAVNEKCRRSRE